MSKIINAIFVLSLYILVIIRNSLYPNLVYQFYQGKILQGFYGYYFLIMRVALTRFTNGEKPKSIFRNLTFNCIRQLHRPLWAAIILKNSSQLTYQFISTQITAVFIVTFIFQQVPLNIFKQQKFIWIYLQMEYFLGFPFDVLQQVIVVFDQNFLFKGNVFRFLITYFFLIHNRLGINYIEDFIFRDMNTLNSKNFPQNYLTFIFLIFGVIIYQISNLGVYFKIDYPSDSISNCVDLKSKIFEEECHPRLLGFHQDISFYNQDNVVFYDIANITFMLWISYGLLLQLNSVSDLNLTEKVQQIKDEKIQNNKQNHVKNGKNKMKVKKE